MTRRLSAITYVTVGVLCTASVANAEDKPNWGAVAEQFDPLARLMATVHHQGYEMDYTQEMDTKVGPVYLVSGIPIRARESADSPSNDYSTRRPASALITSVLYENPFEVYPVENVLIYARLLEEGILAFDCKLSVSEGVTRSPCKGMYDITSGDLEFEVNRLFVGQLIADTKKALGAAPKSECEDHYYKAEMARMACSERSMLGNLTCAVNSYLRSIDQCRPGPFTDASLVDWEVFQDDCDRCPLMVKIVAPEGEYARGSPDSEEGRGDDELYLPVTFSAGLFAVGIHEITVGEYRRFAEETERVDEDGCCVYIFDRENQKGEFVMDGSKSWKEPGIWQTDQHPVVCVSWSDAREYVEWLTEETGKDYRLLKEGEWEYVARSRWTSDPDDFNTRPPFHFEGLLKSELVNYNRWFPYRTDEESGEYRRGTVSVGSLPPNKYKLHEVHGNVWEWTEDCSDDGCSDERVVRSGSWTSRGRNVRAANRAAHEPDYRRNDLGFRVARMLH